MKTKVCIVCNKSVELRDAQTVCSRECRLLKRREYYQENKAILNAKDSDWYWNLGGKTKSNQQSKNWYARNKERRAEYTKKYRQAQKELFAKYKDLERFGGNKQDVLDRDKNECRLCQAKERLVIHHIDGSGGSHRKGYDNTNNSLSNLITLCFQCHHKIHAYQNRIKQTFKSIDDIVRTMPKVIEEYVTMFPPRKRSKSNS
jgi:hypothetical protein